MRLKMVVAQCYRTDTKQSSVGVLAVASSGQALPIQVNMADPLVCMKCKPGSQLKNMHADKENSFLKGD
jgi:hypothetical protein